MEFRNVRPGMPQGDCELLEKQSLFQLENLNATKVLCQNRYPVPRQNIPVSNWLSGVLIIFSCVNMIFWLARVHSCIDLVFRSFPFMFFNQLKQYFTITSVLSEKKFDFLVIQWFIRIFVPARNSVS